MDEELKTLGVGAASGILAATAYEAWRRSTEKEIVMGRPARLAKVDPASLAFDADTYQFKSGGDARGVTDRLRGVKTWDPVAAGKAIVHERADGTMVVADGHQRTGLAKRLAAEGQSVRMDAYILRERDGWSPRDVRVYAALKNMKESSGQSLDMAKVMRERPDLVNDSIPMSDSKVREAKALANLSDPAFKMVAGGAVKPEVAAAVGDTIKDTTRHADMLDEMAKAKVASAQHARVYVGQALAAPSISETTSSLFGEETQVRSLIKERAQVLDRALTVLKQDKKLFAMLEREAGTIESAGNKLAHEVNATRATESGHMAALVEKLATVRGPLSSMLDRAAEAVAKGEKLPKAARAFTSEVGKTLKTGGIKALTGDTTPARVQAMSGKDDVLDLMRQTRERFDASEKTVREELAKPSPNLIKRQDNGVTLQLTKAPYGNGDFRITRYVDGEPVGHSDFKATDRGIRDAAVEMAPSSGDKSKGRVQAMVEKAQIEVGATYKDKRGQRYTVTGMSDGKVHVDMGGVKLSYDQTQFDRSMSLSKAAPKGQSSFLPEVTTKDQIAAAMKNTGKPGVAQRDVGGLFGDDSKQMDLVDEARKLPAVQSSPYSVVINGKSYPADSLEQASKAYRSTIDSLGLGASESPRATVLDGNGKVVGHVAYNGRVFPGPVGSWKSGDVPLYDPIGKPSGFSDDAAARPSNPNAPGGANRPIPPTAQEIALVERAIKNGKGVELSTIHKDIISRASNAQVSMLDGVAHEYRKLNAATDADFNRVSAFREAFRAQAKATADAAHNAAYPGFSNDEAGKAARSEHIAKVQAEMDARKASSGAFKALKNMGVPEYALEVHPDGQVHIRADEKLSAFVEKQIKTAVKAGQLIADGSDKGTFFGMNPGWSDEARAASAEVRAAKPLDAWTDAEKFTTQPNGEKRASKEFIKALTAEAKALPKSDPTRSMKIEHAKIIAGTAWRADGSAYVPALKELTDKTLKDDQAKAFAQTKRGKRSKDNSNVERVRNLQSQAMAAKRKVFSEPNRPNKPQTTAVRDGSTVAWATNGKVEHESGLTKSEAMKRAAELRKQGYAPFVGAMDQALKDAHSERQKAIINRDFDAAGKKPDQAAAFAQGFDKRTPKPPREGVARYTPEEIAKGEARWVNRLRAIDGAPGRTDAELKAEYRQKMGIQAMEKATGGPRGFANEAVQKAAQAGRAAASNVDDLIASTKKVLAAHTAASPERAKALSDAAAQITNAKLSKADAHKLAAALDLPVSKSTSGKAAAGRVAKLLNSTSTTVRKILAVGGRGAASILGPAAVVGAGAVAFDATRNTAMASGSTDQAANIKGGMAAAGAAGTVAAVGWGIGKGIQAAAKAAPAIGKFAARAVPAVALGFAGYEAVKGGIAGYKNDGSIAGALKGAGIGVADFATMGAYSHFDVKASGARLTPEQIAQFKAAEANHKAMKESAEQAKSTPKKRGFANPAVQKAAQEGRGVKNVSPWANDAAAAMQTARR